MLLISVLKLPQCVVEPQGLCVLYNKKDRRGRVRVLSKGGPAKNLYTKSERLTLIAEYLGPGQRTVCTNDK
jgi:hypothetical protein